MTESMRDQTLGFELEMTGPTCNPCARAAAAYALQNVFGGTVVHVGGSYDKYRLTDSCGRKWYFVTDSSIHTPGGGYAIRDLQCELNSPVLTWDDLPDAVTAVDTLRDAGFVTDPAYNGIHVHVGLGDHTPDSLIRLAQLVNGWDALIRKAIGFNPARERWAEANPEFIQRVSSIKKHNVSWETLARAYYDCNDWMYHALQHYSEYRYCLLNLHSVFYRAYHEDRYNPDWKKATIEFRCFNATMDSRAIDAYLKFCAAVSFSVLHTTRSSSASKSTDNPAYTFRCWLLRLGLNGDEFKNTRSWLLRNLPGNAAWRHGDATQRRS